MSKDEIKSEINKVLDQLSDKSLEDLLSLLRNLTAGELFDKHNVEKILSEDKELLQKLAQ